MFRSIAVTLCFLTLKKVNMAVTVNFKPIEGRVNSVAKFVICLFRYHCQWDIYGITTFKQKHGSLNRFFFFFLF